MYYLKVGSMTILFSIVLGWFYEYAYDDGFVPPLEVVHILAFIILGALLAFGAVNNMHTKNVPYMLLGTVVFAAFYTSVNNFYHLDVRVMGLMSFAILGCGLGLMSSEVNFEHHNADGRGMNQRIKNMDTVLRTYGTISFIFFALFSVFTFFLPWWSPSVNESGFVMLMIILYPVIIFFCAFPQFGLDQLQSLLRSLQDDKATPFEISPFVRHLIPAIYYILMALINANF